MKMRNLLDLSACLLILLATVQGAIAAPLPCAVSGTYQDLLNSNAAGGCTISAGGGVSLTFTNFQFNPAGVGTPTADQVGYTLDDPGVAVGGGPIFGFEFNPGLAISAPATPNAHQDIQISYTVIPMGAAIISDHLLMNGTATGTGQAVVSEVLQFCIASDPNNTSGTCRVFPNTLTVSTGGALHNDAFFPPWTSMSVSKDMSATSGVVGGTANISQVRDAVDLVPEPTTYGLFSIGFLVFGYFARRHRG